MRPFQWFFSLCVIPLAACHCGPAFFECDGITEDVVKRVIDVGDRWNVADDVRRLDYMCVSRERIADRQHCWRDVEACTFRRYTWPYRVRVYSRTGGEEIVPIVEHEAQHWYLTDTTGDDCPSHCGNDGIDWHKQPCSPPCGWDRKFP